MSPEFRYSNTQFWVFCRWKGGSNPDRMKKLTLIGLLLPLVTLSQQNTKDQIWSMLESHNPDAHIMMKRLYDLPSKFKLGTATMTVSKPSDFMVYISDDNFEQVLSSISTAVHEACHMYQSKKGFQIIDEQNLNYEFGAQYAVYYINEATEFLVKETEVFPSIQIARLVPKELRKSRYDTYIDSKNKILGTQQSGVYGLMDEWSAYYNGFKTTVMNYPIYESKASDNVGYFLNYISDASNTKLSYYEFKYFILQYLSYARSKEKKIYKELMTNAEMKKACRAIDAAFIDVMSEYDDKVAQIQNLAEETGERFERTADFIWIGNRGVGTYEDEIMDFKKALANPDFEAILADLTN